MKLRMTTALVAAGCAMSLAGVAQAQALKSEPPMKEFTEEEIAEIAMPELEYDYDRVDPKDYEKYFYFHREETSFSVAYADILECDSLGSGSSYYSSSLSNAMISSLGQYGVLGGALGGAIGAAIGDAIFGSSERRKLKRINIRNCMYFKGYDRYGLKKDLWQEFHFEEGNSREEASSRAAALLQQARVASGPKPTTQVLAP